MNDTLTTKVAQATTILETMDYSVFKHVSWNRKIRRSLVDKIKKSMVSEGFASYAPILVNDDMVILDGQHRFTAAKELGIPVKYMIVAEDTKQDALILMNTNKISWTPEDFAGYYAAKGNPYYIGLMDFATRHKVSCGVAFTFIHGTHIHNTRDCATIYQQGKWSYSPEAMQQAEKDICAIAKILELLNLPFRRTVYRALLSLSKTPGFSWERMVDKAVKFRDRAYSCSNLKGYVQMFLDLYNYKARTDSVLNIGRV